MRRKLARAALRLIGPALLVVVVLRMGDRGAILHVLARAAVLPLLLAVALNALNAQLKVMRWDVILRTRGIEYPLRRAWGAFMTSIYLGMLTPGRVGDVLRVQYLHHDLDVPYAEGLASVVIDRFCDLYVLVAFVAVGVARYSSVVVGELAWITWLGVGATAVGPLLFLVPGLAERTMGAVYRRVAGGDEGGLSRFLEALRANVGRPLLVTIPLTVATFVVNYVQGWLIARALGLDIGIFDVTCLLAIANLLGLMPISVSGVGVREFFFALVFPVLGHTPEEGVSFGLVVFAVLYLAVVLAGAVSWQLAPPPMAPDPRPPAA